MSHVIGIKQEAIIIANAITSRIAGLKKEKAGFEDRVRQLQIEIQENQLATDRLATFQAERNGVEQCPRCWIAHEVATNLTALPNDDRDDEFRCRTCGYHIVFPGE